MHQTKKLMFASAFLTILLCAKPTCATGNQNKDYAGAGGGAYCAASGACDDDFDGVLERPANDNLRLRRLESGSGGAVRVPPGYNRYVQPPGRPDGSAEVAVGFVVSDVMEVDDEDYTISIKVG